MSLSIPFLHNRHKIRLRHESILVQTDCRTLHEQLLQSPAAKPQEGPRKGQPFRRRPQRIVGRAALPDRREVLQQHLAFRAAAEHGGVFAQVEAVPRVLEVREEGEILVGTRWVSIHQVVERCIWRYCCGAAEGFEGGSHVVLRGSSDSRCMFLCLYVCMRINLIARSINER